MLTLLMLLAISGKRTAPAPVTPLVHDGVRYAATGCCTVTATLARDRRLLWRCEVYRIDVDPNLERDVQDVFITRLSFRGNRLLVDNEAGERFALKPESGVVTVLRKEPRARTRPSSCSVRH